MDTKAITVSGLTKIYANGVRALDAVSFEVGRGEVFAYLGRNGQGKTTTVRILCTLTAPTEGSAMVAGHDVARDAVAVRRAIGVTMQAAALDPSMTGREHLEFVAGLMGHSRSHAEVAARRLLDSFSLTEAADRPTGTYSGGMRRRLDLAGALLDRPQVLFLDEPTTGLDAQSRRALWQQVRELRDEGTAIFLTTQYLEEAEALADRVAVLEGGRIVATDTVVGLLASTGTTSLEEAFIRLTGEDAELQPVLMKGV